MTRIVLDASAVVEYLRWSAAGRDVADIVATDEISLHIPHLCTVEVTHAFRSLSLRALIGEDRAEAALSDLADLPATRHSAEPLLPRIWQLREQLTTYDANYVALAEALDATLLTADVRLARSSGHAASILIVGSRTGQRDGPA
ncbi:MAG: type II toxin-antitoxin system VapC family toxin [Candidatus Nanopelagicales bacterium]|nr:type II toxin-antitoxin system VapC family toxin [Candidatus Nanopelagicales bacterium]